MAAKNLIKAVLATKGMTMTDLVNLLNEKHDRKDSLANLSKKLNTNTLKFREAEEIAEVLNCQIKIVMKEDNREFF